MIETGGGNETSPCISIRRYIMKKTPKIPKTNKFIIESQPPNRSVIATEMIKSGRGTSKVFVDKKKEENKNRCRDGNEKE